MNEAIAEGGESYFRYRQIEMLPQIAPAIARRWSRRSLVTIAGGENGGAAKATTNSITSVIQTVLAAQLVSSAAACWATWDRTASVRRPAYRR